MDEREVGKECTPVTNYVQEDIPETVTMNLPFVCSSTSAHLELDQMFVSVFFWGQSVQSGMFGKLVRAFRCLAMTCMFL